MTLSPAPPASILVCKLDTVVTSLLRLVSAGAALGDVSSSHSPESTCGNGTMSSGNQLPVLLTNPALLKRENRRPNPDPNTHRGRLSSSRRRGSIPVPVSAVLSSLTVRCLRRARGMHKSLQRAQGGSVSHMAHSSDQIQ